MVSAVEGTSEGTLGTEVEEKEAKGSLHQIVERQILSYEEFAPGKCLKYSHELHLVRPHDQTEVHTKPSELFKHLTQAGNPIPTTPQGLAEGIIQNIGPNRENLITNLKQIFNGILITVEGDKKNYLKGFQPYIDKGQITVHSDGSLTYDPHSLLPSVVNNIQSLIAADQKSFSSSFSTALKGYLVGVGSQINPIQNFPYDKDTYQAAIDALTEQETQVFIDTFYTQLQMGTPPVLSKLQQNVFPSSSPSPFEPKTLVNQGFDAMDSYISLNLTDPISLFPDQGPTLSPSIASLPFSSWWEVLGNQSSKMVGLQVLDDSSTPSVAPPSLNLQTIQALYQKTPSLFPMYGSNIENMTEGALAPGVNANIFLKEGTLAAGNTVFLVGGAINGNPQPNGNPGIYNVGNTGTGLVFSNPESYLNGKDVNWKGYTLTFQPGSEALAELGSTSSPIFQNGPLNPHGTITPTGENSIVYQQQNDNGETVTIPVVKNSPYLSVYTHDTAPQVFFNTLGSQISGVSTFAYQNDEWVQQGNAITSGTTPQGQLFRVEISGVKPTSYFTLYTDQPQSFTLTSSFNKRIVPDGTEIPTPQMPQYIAYTEAKAAAEKAGITLPTADEMNWFAATIQVPEEGGAPNRLVGCNSAGNQVMAVAKIPAAQATLADDAEESLLDLPPNLPIDRGVGFLPLQSDFKGVGASANGVFNQTVMTFYPTQFPGASSETYMGQLLNNFQHLNNAPDEPPFYYQTMCGVMRMVPFSPSKTAEGTYSATFAYETSENYGLYDPETLKPTSPVDWMESASEETLQLLVGALTDPHLIPSSLIWDQDYSLSQQIQTNVQTALEAKTLLDLATAKKLTLTPQQITTLTNVQAQFLADAKERLGVFLGSLSWDPKHHLLVSIYGNEQGSGDFYNNLGEDLQFTNGYMIHSAAMIRMLDPSYFETPDATTPYVWDTPTPGSIPNQAMYRARIVDALLQEVDPSETTPQFPRGRQLDNETHLFKSHGWNIPTLGGQDLESTAEAINFSRGGALWNHLQAEGTTDPTIKQQYETDRNVQLNHGVLGTQAAQTFRNPAHPQSIYLDPLADPVLKEYGVDSTLSNITFVRQRTSDTYWGPGPKGFALAPLGATTMQGINMLGETLDKANAEKIVETFFYDVFHAQDKTLRETPDWSQITQSTIFQNVGWQKEPPVQTAIAVIFMTTLPFLARYSPNLSLAILSWYNQEHATNPKVFQWHPGDNLAVVMNYILQNKAANEKDPLWKDPVTESQMAEIKTALFSMMGQSDTESFPQNSSDRRRH